MDDTTDAGTAALASAARTAGHAPSVHNTQPWRWRVQAPALLLLADRTRQLKVADPDGRLLLLSCGAALHHARVALAAEGWAVRVERLPDDDNPDLLARLTLTGPAPVTGPALRHMQTVRIRRTDRRPVSPVPVAADVLEEIRRAAIDEGAQLHLLRPQDVFRLAAVAAQAEQSEGLDPQWREEIAYWATRAAGDPLGVPADAIPTEMPRTTVPGRDFTVAGTLDISTEHDKAASYAILYGDEDSPAGWLRGGEALSAAWLAATEHDASLLPLSASVEVTSTREALHQMLSFTGHPYLVVRVGAPDPDRAGPPHTPRLPAEQVVEVVSDTAR